MNPYHQQGQSGNPQQKNPCGLSFFVGVSNTAPQSMPGLPTTGYLAPQAGYPAPQAEYPARWIDEAGFSNTGGISSQQSHSYPYSAQGYPQPNSTLGPQPGQNEEHIESPPDEPQSKPTVVPANPFDPRKDAEVLRKAMKGFGTDEKAIIQVLTRRSNDQRLEIADEFKTLYGKNLVSALKSKTSGKFKDLLVALMTPLAVFYAKELHDATAGSRTDEDVLIEVMCSQSNDNIKIIKETYVEMYKKQLEDDLRGDTSEHFKKLMTSLCMGNRSEEFEVDKGKAREDAKSLLQAGKLRLGTDKSILMLCLRSFPQLAAIFQEYQNLTGDDIDKAIKSEFSGELEKALRAIVKVVRNKPLFFAMLLHKSMKGFGTNDRQLIRIMVTRCEWDLGDIADMFEFKYGKSLQRWIEGDCSGHYKKCLLGLLGIY